MNILVTNHWLKKLGGSETFTYTIIKELLRLGHHVEYFTLHPGMVSKRIEDLGISDRCNFKYDLILANHNSTIKELFKMKMTGPIVQTCHGVYPKLEQPCGIAHYHVSISEEVANNLAGKGFKSEIILNGIDLDRFRIITPPGEKVRSVLSMVHSDDLNRSLELIFRNAGIEFHALNKYENPAWDVENFINQHDLVITLGRGAYEAMACGRPVLILDKRPYVNDTLGDGLLTPDNFNQVIRNNCSGRRYKRTDLREMIDQAIQCNPRDLGNKMKDLAYEYFDVKKNIQKYLDYAGY